MSWDRCVKHVPGQDKAGFRGAVRSFCTSSRRPQAAARRDRRLPLTLRRRPGSEPNRGRDIDRRRANEQPERRRDRHTHGQDDDLATATTSLCGHRLRSSMSMPPAARALLALDPGSGLPSGRALRRARPTVSGQMSEAARLPGTPGSMLSTRSRAMSGGHTPMASRWEGTSWAASPSTSAIRSPLWTSC